MKPGFVLSSIGFAFICSLFFILGLPGVNGIKCWVCRSDSDPKCADPFDNTSLPIYDCATEKLSQLPSVPSTMCRKTRQKVNGNWRFIRTCAFLGKPGEGHEDENYCLMRTGTYNVFMETCTCKSKDGCNTASNLKTSFLFILSVLALLYVTSKLDFRQRKS